jgi:hypothetical protein
MSTVPVPEKISPGERLPRDLDIVVQVLHVLLDKPTGQSPRCLQRKSRTL